MPVIVNDLDVEVAEPPEATAPAGQVPEVPTAAELAELLTRRAARLERLRAH